ncbi:MAG: hypothetical protein KatS3mg114_0821 [Planctomycetaceae bacterium]|nr:MAG: hypothetical protein KatS3mg114_0821 [Planctomycetaceae bacterium]
MADRDAVGQDFEVVLGRPVIERGDGVEQLGAREPGGRVVRRQLLVAEREIGLGGIDERDAEQFRGHQPIHPLHVLADEAGERLADLQRPGVLLVLHRLGQRQQHQPGVLLQPLVANLEVRRRVNQELFGSRQRVRRLHVEDVRRHRSRRQDRPRPSAEFVDAGQRVDRRRRPQPGIGMPQNCLQIATDDIGQITDRVVLRLGVVGEVRDREAEPAPVTDVVPEEGIVHRDES